MPHLRSAGRTAVAAGLALSACLIALMAAVSIASAHSFYPLSCCSEVDCFPVPLPRDLVRAAPGGWYLLKEGVTVPYEATRPSPDGLFHICRDELGKGKLITPKGELPCLWAPEGAS